VSPAPAPKHQFTSGDIFSLVKSLVPNGHVVSAPIDAYFDEKNTVQPDIVWIGENSRCVIGEKMLEDPPDLIVEIFSPGTAKRDKKEKFQLYERYGVREYWLVDPIGQYIEVFQLVNGKFVQQGVYGRGDSFVSAVFGGKTVKLDTVFRE
jgi:Uma2 family endonuclease